MAKDDPNDAYDYTTYGKVHSTSPLGVMLVIALLAIAIIAYFGVRGPGLLTIESSIWALGVALLVVTLCLLYVLFALKSMLRTAREQASQVAILRAQQYANTMQAHHKQEPHQPQFFVQVLPETTPETAAQAAPAATTARGSWPVETIEGIGKAYGAKLSAAGIKTLNDLRGAAPGRIEETCNVSGAVAAHWKAMAELLMVDGLGPDEAEVLAFCGIPNARALAHHEPTVLYNGVRTVLQSRPNIYPEEVDVTTVRTWVNAARVHVRAQTKTARTKGAERPPSPPRTRRTKSGARA